MNITFFIGNGYDLTNNLKTSYKDFLKWYADQKSASRTIAFFKKDIEEDFNTWSDLELALGQKTSAPPLNDESSLIECKSDLDDSLRAYLLAEDKKFKSSILDEYEEQFRDSLINFGEICDERTKQELKQISLRVQNKKNIYNIVNFNFTKTVDVLWNRLPKFLDSAPPNKGSFNYFLFQKKQSLGLSSKEFHHIKGELFHIHGTVNKQMTIGLNDASQIINESLRNSPTMTGLLIKPSMNDNCNNQKNERLLKLIEKTNVFVVFGMSIGATDKIWWDAIVKQLQNEDTYLILVNYDSKYSHAFPYRGQLTSAKLCNNLFCVTGVPAETQLFLKNKMTVLLNTNMFRFQKDNAYERKREFITKITTQRAKSKRARQSGKSLSIEWYWLYCLCYFIGLIVISLFLILLFFSLLAKLDSSLPQGNN